MRLKNCYDRIARETCQFHTEEDGIEAIQVVMLLGAAGVALITIRDKWQDILGFFRENASLAISWSP